MRKKIIIACALVLTSVYALAQKRILEDPTLAIYKLLSNESINLKDSLAIYALNFELSISKDSKGTKITNIAANDSLAFNLFPSHKKFSNIDFSLLMGKKSKIRLIVPILIYGSSPEKISYKDKDGNPLISLNAAVNAAYYLYNPIKYNNKEDSKVLLGHLLVKKLKNKKQEPKFWDTVTMEPIIIIIHNIK